MMGVMLALAVSLLCEAFFSGAELALISADKVKLRHLAESDSRRRRRILRFLEEPGDLISTALVGTNICVVFSAVVTTLALMPQFPESAELITLLVITPVILVFGEIVPKSIFQHYADRTAPRLISILTYFRWVFLPLVELGRGLSGVLLRIFKIAERPAVMTREELKLLITLPSKVGADRITPDERKMVTGVFELAETTVDSILVPLIEVSALPTTASVADAVREIEDKRHTRLPVYEERIDKIVGILHAFDVFRAESRTPLQALLRPAIYVPEAQPAVDTLVRLQREGQHMAIVVDEYAGAIGIVTIEDILEEVVGDIRDEHDPGTPQLIRPQLDGSYLVTGRAEIDDLNERLSFALPVSDEYETVAGLVLEELKRIPVEGEVVVTTAARIVVTKVSQMAVEEVKVIPRRRG
jgi:CBS domain containing-hemolysin-like protein